MIPLREGKVKANTKGAPTQPRPTALSEPNKDKIMSQEKLIKLDKNLPVEIVAIIDSSGSMQSIRSDAIGGFNSFIEDQQAQEGEANFTSVTFDTTVKSLQESVKVADAIKFDDKNYRPGGGTALYDAIGLTISKFKDKRSQGKVDKLVCAILTDGEENSSREFTAEKVKELITEAETEFGWIFVFLAANQDAFTAGNKLGIDSRRTLNFVASAAGTNYAMRGVSTYATTYRTKGLDADYSQVQRELQNSEEK